MTLAELLEKVLLRCFAVVGEIRGWKAPGKGHLVERLG